MYKIGDFSKIVNIPVRTLRFYAEYKVLVPKEIDPYTGYKYYSDENVIECELIKLLKSLDFTLEEIIKYKDNIDFEVLEKKKKEIEERMFLLKSKYDKLIKIQNELYKKNDIIEEDKVLRRNYENGSSRENKEF